MQTTWSSKLRQLPTFPKPSYGKGHRPLVTVMFKDAPAGMLLEAWRVLVVGVGHLARFPAEVGVGKRGHMEGTPGAESENLLQVRAR